MAINITKKSISKYSSLLHTIHDTKILLIYTPGVLFKQKEALFLHIILLYVEKLQYYTHIIELYLQ